MARILATLVIATLATAEGSSQASASSVGANPIRKVVTLLQNLEKKIAAEAAAETKLYERYMCYCKSGAGDLEKSIAASDAKIPEVESAIKEASAQKVQLDADVKQHQTDRAAAKSAMETASALRSKEAAAFAAMKSEADSNIDALAKAAAAIDKGMAGAAFIQSDTAQQLRNIFQTAQISNIDREDMLAFLAGSTNQGYAPQGGEITGILKQLHDEFSKNLADATTQEDESVKSFDGLMAAKEKEVAALTASIEDKVVRSGNTAVSIVEMKNDLSDTGKALLDDKKFLEDLSKNCATKKSEWAEITKMRSEESIAIAETIQLLNNDDALDLFKKTLPSGAASFLQVERNTLEVRTRTSSLLRSMRSSANKASRPQVDFILLALSAKQRDFSGVIKMIDDMVVLLQKEQSDDDSKKEYCETALDAAADKAKGLKLTIADAEKAAADAEEGIATLAEEIKALKAGIEALDKSVVEATATRKTEHEEYVELVASNNAAIELIGIAKNRLNKFYNKALYKAPPKRELSEEDRIAVNIGGTAPPTPAPGGIAGTGVTVLAQVSVHSNLDDAPAPPPETFSAYKSKSEGANGIIAMLDLLVADLEKEITEAETSEKDAQVDYEQMSSDAAAKRAADASATTDKEGAKANLEGALQDHMDKKASTSKELVATAEYISSMHGECDWLLGNFLVRKEARAAEVESLGKAKDVLSGADYSLIQTRTRSLRGRA